jgi:hypothetical protein
MSQLLPFQHCWIGIQRAPKTPVVYLFSGRALSEGPTVPRPCTSVEGSMKKYLFLCLLFLVFTGRAAADGIGTNCLTGPGGDSTSLITNGQFQAIACLSTSGLNTRLYINGPAGLETFELPKGEGTADFIDLFYTLLLNDQGEVVLAYDVMGGFTDVVAAYTGPGLVQTPPFGFDLPGSTISDSYATLIPNPPSSSGAPVYPLDPPRNFPAMGFQEIVFTGITDSGVISGNEQYFYNGFTPDPHPIVSIPVSWTFAPVPEPATLMLLIPGLLALAAFRLKKATA